MNNQELELKVKEILNNKNFFDMVEAVVAFEKEYKGTDFYKKTKMPLMEVIKNAKMWYSLQLEDIGRKVQDFINGIDLGNLTNLVDQIGDVFGQENEETLNILREFKDIVK